MNDSFSYKAYFETCELDVTKLVAILGRSLTEAEQLEIEFTCDCYGTRYHNGRGMEPDENPEGVLETIEFEGKDVTPALTKKQVERVEEDVNEQWSSILQDERDRYENHLCDLADARRKGEI
jgi:hypothetical protein